jgi:hypothetical protein
MSGSIGKINNLECYLNEGPYGRYLRYDNKNFTIPDWGKKLLDDEKFDIKTAKNIIDYKLKNIIKA